MGLDFFDGSINILASWIIGTRAFQKALLIVMLEPKTIIEAEANFDFATRLALMEKAKQLDGVQFGICIVSKMMYQLDSIGLTSKSI